MKSSNSLGITSKIVQPLQILAKNGMAIGNFCENHAQMDSAVERSCVGSKFKLQGGVQAFRGTFRYGKVTLKYYMDTI